MIFINKLLTNLAWDDQQKSLVFYDVRESKIIIKWSKVFKTNINSLNS